MTTSTGDVNVLNGIAAKKKTAQMCRTMAIAARRFDSDVYTWQMEVAQ